MKEEVKEEESKFVITVNKEGRVSVDITGRHINNTTFKRSILAMKKSYRLHIRAYRKRLKRNMSKEELENVIAEPTSLDVEANGRVLDIADATGGSDISSIMHQLVDNPITAPIAKVVESKKLSLNEIIAAKQAKKLAETKS